MKLTALNLLESYKNLWSERTLPSELSAEETLHQVIKRELLDELTHPRLRKSQNEKYYLAVERIVQSSLELAHKVELIKRYTQIHSSIEGE
ncbi:hypothetical protein [Jeotgalibacillus marinus]|uniref:Uncharacterized protein n=1 Tax=Jeotgalibacillus marinus TaxID=86667 RepID=A0ABV3Q384_9BACL